VQRPEPDPFVPTYTAAQVREAESPYLERGVPLMDRAAAALAESTAELVETRCGTVTAARVLVLAGAGNNGGDALFAAARLADRGASVSIVPTSTRLHEAGLEAALAAGAGLRPLDEPVDEVAALARAADVILDGILGTGTGTEPALRGRAREVVAAILPVLAESAGMAGSDGSAGVGGGDVGGGGAANPLRRPAVVAVDLPSGIGVDDGSVPDPTVLPADLTVTFGGGKTGLLLAPAAHYAGRVVVADIGIREELERIRRRDRADAGKVPSEDT
jgi:NAD(P)H-hydrate epimerase